MFRSDLLFRWRRGQERFGGKSPSRTGNLGPDAVGPGLTTLARTCAIVLRPLTTRRRCGCRAANSILVRTQPAAGCYASQCSRRLGNTLFLRCFPRTNLARGTLTKSFTGATGKGKQASENECSDWSLTARDRQARGIRRRTLKKRCEHVFRRTFQPLEDDGLTRVQDGRPTSVLSVLLGGFEAQAGEILHHDGNSGASPAMIVRESSSRVPVW